MTFTQDDYFEPSEFNLHAFSSFIILKPTSQFTFSYDLSLPSVSFFKTGDDIMCISSSLSTFLYDYFNSSVSRGVILINS